MNTADVKLAWRKQALKRRSCDDGESVLAAARRHAMFCEPVEERRPPQWNKDPILPPPKASSASSTNKKKKRVILLAPSAKTREPSRQPAVIDGVSGPILIVPPPALARLPLACLLSAAQWTQHPRLGNSPSLSSYSHTSRYARRPSFLGDGSFRRPSCYDASFRIETSFRTVITTPRSPPSSSGGSPPHPHNTNTTHHHHHHHQAAGGSGHNNNNNKQQRTTTGFCCGPGKTPACTCICGLPLTSATWCAAKKWYLCLLPCICLPLALSCDLLLHSTASWRSRARRCSPASTKEADDATHSLKKGKMERPRRRSYYLDAFTLASLATAPRSPATPPSFANSFKVLRDVPSTYNHLR